MSEWVNQLYYGDNLDILQRYIEDDSVDLVYLDPPFNSDADYNVLFAEEDGSRAAAQIKAFDDTWRWDQAAALAFEQTVDQGGEIAKAMKAFRTLLGPSNMLAYLAMMAPRLLELKRVLKDSGSIFLHCDPTASHYLKLLMDSIFGPENFRNEVIWRRTGSHAPSRKFGPIHDTLLFYACSPDSYFVPIKRPHMLGHIAKRFKEQPDGSWKEEIGGNIMTGAGITKGDSGKPWRGMDPTASNRHWAIPGDLAAQMPEEFQELEVREKLEALYQAGLLEINDKWKWPHPVRYLDEDEAGVPIGDIWASQPYTGKWAKDVVGTVYNSDEDIDDDVRWLGTQDAERLGYPTQKPTGLLKRVIDATCPEDGVVLDPFAGCGTTVIAAEELRRKWIGIDITYLAIGLLKNRLSRLKLPRPYVVKGEPTSISEAKELASSDPYHFQWWALDLVNARPLDEKKGADAGIDGQVTFYEADSDPREIIFSVKAGKVSVSQVRDLVGVITREEADIGVLISLNKPTGPMIKEAASSGSYNSSLMGTSHPRVQLITVGDLLEGKTLDLPNLFAKKGMKTAPAKRAVARTPQLSLSEDQEDDD